MLDELQTFVASGLLATAGGAACYIQRLFNEDGSRKADGSILGACGWILGSGVFGISLSLWLYQWFGDTVEGRLGIIGLNGMLALAGIGVQAILPKILRHYGMWEDKDARNLPKRRGRTEPDSDSRPI